MRTLSAAANAASTSDDIGVERSAGFIERASPKRPCVRRESLTPGFVNTIAPELITGVLRELPMLEVVLQPIENLLSGELTVCLGLGQAVVEMVPAIHGPPRSAWNGN